MLTNVRLYDSLEFRFSRHPSSDMCLCSRSAGRHLLLDRDSQFSGSSRDKGFFGRSWLVIVEKESVKAYTLTRLQRARGLRAAKHGQYEVTKITIRAFTSIAEQDLVL